MPAPVELIKQVPLFNDLDKSELTGLASSMKERQFDEGSTVATEGQTGIGFFIIDEGEATVTVQGREVRTLKHGDYFGEVALIDDGARTATITAETDLVCQGLTYWEFRPLVQQNATIAWNLLRTLAHRLRTAQDEAHDRA